MTLVPGEASMRDRTYSAVRYKLLTESCRDVASRTTLPPEQMGGVGFGIIAWQRSRHCGDLRCESNKSYALDKGSSKHDER